MSDKAFFFLNSDIKKIEKILVNATITNKQIKKNSKLITITYSNINKTIISDTLYNKYKLNSYIKVYLIKIYYKDKIIEDLEFINKF